MDPHLDYGAVLLQLMGLAVLVLIALALVGRALYKRSTQYHPGRYAATVMPHPLADRRRLEADRDHVRDQIETITTDSSEASGKAFRLRVQLAQYGLALGESPDLVRGQLAAAAQLGAAQAEGSNRERSLEILFFVAAFSTRAERLDVARQWATRRSAPDDPESRVALGEGMAELILGEGAAARAQFDWASRYETQLALKAIAHAALAFIDHDWPLFDAHIVAALHEHGRGYQNSPRNPAGGMNVFALALCRLAKDAGVPTVERSYLPLSLLPVDPA